MAQLTSPRALVYLKGLNSSSSFLSASKIEFICFVLHTIEALDLIIYLFIYLLLIKILRQGYQSITMSNESKSQFAAVVGGCLRATNTGIIQI